MAILVDNPQIFYQFFYLLTFVFIYAVVVYNSIRRGYHLRSVLLMLTTITLFIVIGTRLFTINIANWMEALSFKSAEFNNRSSIGGVLFGLVGLLVSQQLFRSKRDMVDLFAWLAPIGLAITKLGCLVNGCCFGLPTNGFWGIQYPVTTNAHYNHWATGTIETDAILSSAVHPVQLYESLVLLIIGFVVWKTHKRWKMNASALLFALFLYFTLRFGVEFFRDHSVSQFGTAHYLGVWAMQWGMLALGLVLGLAVWLNEKRYKSELRSPYIHSEFIFILALSVIIFLFRNLLQAFELSAVWIIFIPALVLVCYHFLNESRLKRHRRMIAALLLLPFVVLAQSIPESTLDSQTKADTEEPSEITKYHRIDLGVSFGDFANEVYFNPVNSECGGTTYEYEYFKQVYKIAGAGYSQVSIKDNNTTTFGANVSGGTIKSTRLSSNESESEFVYAVNPYFKWDSKWFGAGAGLHVGNMQLNKQIGFSAQELEEARKTYSFLPEFHVRVGPQKYLDVDYNYGFMMPSAFPTLYSRSSLGSSFGLGPDYSLRIGTIWNVDTGYVSTEALLSDNLGIHVMYIFEETKFDVPFADTSGKFVVSLNYRFGHKTK